MIAVSSEVQLIPVLLLRNRFTFTAQPHVPLNPIRLSSLRLDSRIVKPTYYCRPLGIDGRFLNCVTPHDSRLLAPPVPSTARNNNHQTDTSPSFPSPCPCVTPNITLTPSSMTYRRREIYHGTRTHRPTSPSTPSPPSSSSTRRATASWRNTTPRLIKPHLALGLLRTWVSDLVDREWVGWRH